jgi:MFS family permease
LSQYADTQLAIRAVAGCSGVGEAREQRDRFREHLPLPLGEAIGDRACQPAGTLATLELEYLTSPVGELEQGAASVGGIWAAADQPIRFEFADDLRHRLWTHALGGGQIAGSPGAFTVEAAEHSAVREREAVLGAQPPRQLAEHDPKVAGDEGDIDGQGDRTITATADQCTGNLYRLPVYYLGVSLRRNKHASAATTGTAAIAGNDGSIGSAPVNDKYKWIALSNVTLGVLLAVLDGSIVLIAMPSIFRGIHLDPLVPANSFYLLWMILGFLVVTSVLIVSLGRLGDMYGRVKMYNLGFLVYTIASLFLTVDWMTGRAGALYLIAFRVVQGVGAAFLLANSAAILTDAFPANQRGMALGINNIVGVSGTFIGLVLGGLLAPIDWRLVFLISVPIGLFGTVWAYLKLEERSTPKRAKVDWWGNLTFAIGLILIMVSVTYGIRPYGGHATGWTSPKVLILLGTGVASLVAFALIEWRVEDPMFRLPLFRIRAFTFGTLSTFLSAVARGGLMFMLIIWLQGIWLPQHGYDFTETPLWAGIYMLPLIVGMLLAGPTSGFLSDRFGARWFATGGMLGAALSFFLLALLPIDFPYPLFAAILFLNGVSMGMFASPNRAAVMNSLPASDRGAGGGMNQTFQNSAQVLSIGIFFTLMIIGLSSSLPSALTTGLKAHGVSAATAAGVAHLPPVSILFAAFLGYNPIQHLLGAHALSGISAHNQAVLVGKSFFPHLISAPFRAGLHEAFAFAIIACLIAAAASLMRGGKYHHTAPDSSESSEQAPPKQSSQLRPRVAASTIANVPIREEQHAS